MKSQLQLKSIVLLIFSFVLLCWSSINTFAEISRQIPRQTMEYWSCIGKMESESNWKFQYSIMSQLYSFSPFDAQINTDLARLHEWQAINSVAWSNTAMESRNTAIGYYRATTELRPTWATGWINLIKSKTINQQFDQELLQAFSNAFRFGQNQTGIQSQIIWLGLGTWNSLDKKTKQNIRSLISNLLAEGKKEDYILLTAFRFSWVKELELLSNNEKLNKRIAYFKNNTEALQKAFAPAKITRACIL